MIWKNPINKKYYFGEIMTNVFENRQKHSYLMPTKICTLINNNIDINLMQSIIETQWIRKSAFFKVLINTMLNSVTTPTDSEIDKATKIFQVELSNYCDLMFPIWEELKKSTDYNFNPLENYDRYEDSNTENKGKIGGNNTRVFEKGAEKTTNTNDYGVAETEDNRTDTANNTMKYGEKISSNSELRKNSPFDSENFYNNEQNTNSNTENARNDSEENSFTSKNIHTQKAKTDIFESEKTSYTDSETNTENSTNENTSKTVSHIHGNIGVTTSSQMLTEYRELVDYNLLDIILSDIQKEFMICVYD